VQIDGNSEFENLARDRADYFARTKSVWGSHKLGFNVHNCAFSTVFRPGTVFRTTKLIFRLRRHRRLVTWGFLSPLDGEKFFHAFALLCFPFLNVVDEDSGEIVSPIQQMRRFAPASATPFRDFCLANFADAFTSPDSCLNDMFAIARQDATRAGVSSKKMEKEARIFVQQQVCVVLL
jgi:hypothetical protein